MKTLKGGLALILCVLALTASTYAGQFYGGKGYLHTATGIGLPPGALDIGLYARGYIASPPGAVSAISNYTTAASANFGFSRHMEFCLTQTLYQDLNLTSRARSQHSITAAIPGEAYVRVKFANYNFKNNFFWGVIPGLRIRTSAFHNIYLEPYQGNAMEVELTGALSYFQKPMFQDEGYSAHVNLGYINHNDRAALQDASQELTYLASFVMSTTKFDYGLEMYGNAFMVKPSSGIFGRENYFYITPMFTYKIFKGLYAIAGVDILAYNAKETTVITGPNPIPPDWPNYPTWRFTTRLQMTPSTPFYVAPTFVDVNDPGTGRERRRSSISPDTGDDLFSREQLFKWAIEERFGDQEQVDVDLDRIRQERRHAEEELARLKVELQQQQQPQQQPAAQPAEEPAK